MKLVAKIWQLILDILFPPLCLNCQGYLRVDEKENLLCHSCFEGIEIYETIFQTDPRFILRAASSYENGALRKMIHYFKYEGFLKARRPIQKILEKYLATLPFPESELSKALVITIPIHKNRLRQRGFNQADLIGLVVSHQLQLPLQTKFLERTRNTDEQIKMRGVKEREKNVRNSILVSPKLRSTVAQYQNFILVDDVYTSGATMKEAVKVLRQAGAKNIIALVIAKAN